MVLAMLLRLRALSLFISTSLLCNTNNIWKAFVLITSGSLQVVLTKTTTMSEPNKKPILVRTSPRIKRSVLPPSVPVEDSNGYGTNTTTRHIWTREENKKLMICYYKSKQKQKGCLRRMEMLWREKHPIATLNMKQLNNQWYSIMKNIQLLLWIWNN